jgi:putative GTP pyrophosphokinase
MTETEDQRLFLEEYGRYVRDVLEPTRDKVKEVLSRWKDPEHWTEYMQGLRTAAPSPVQRVRLRVKRPESVVDKILRKPSDFPQGVKPESFSGMTDVLGARVLVFFTSQLNLVDRELRNSGDFEIAPHAQPIAYLGSHLHEQLGLGHIQRQQKESGYASIHYLLRLARPAAPGNENPWFELQLRTLCEDLWGEIEHVLGYKPGKRTSLAVRKQFRIISRSLEAIDDHFNFLFEELSRYQNEVSFDDTDLLNAENLPAVLGDIGIGCAQYEVGAILKIFVSRGVNRVGELRALAADSRIDMIKNVYRSFEGREPINFELAANIANLAGTTRDVDVAARVRAHIDFLKLWTELNEQKKLRS